MAAQAPLFREDALSIAFLQADRSKSLINGWVHKKTVPFTIIVQPLTGSYNVTCSGKTVSAKPGETILVPSNTEVTFEHCAPRQSENMSAQWVHVSWKIFSTIDATSLINMPLCLNGTPGRQINEIISELFELQKDTKSKPWVALFRRTELGYALLRIVMEHSTVQERAIAHMGQMQRLRTVCEYMQAHISEPLTINSLAQVACLSPSRFFSLFKETTALSPMQFLRKVRLTEACRLLMSTSLSLSRIAVDTGFANQFHFSRAFKEGIGISPREYRKNIY